MLTAAAWYGACVRAGVLCLAVDRCDGEVFETGEHVAPRSAANPAGNWEPLAEGSDASDDDGATDADEDGEEQQEPQAAAEAAP